MDKKCHKCDKPAVHRWSPDLDIEGIYCCEDHKDEIIANLFMLCGRDEDLRKEAEEYFKEVKVEFMTVKIIGGKDG